MVINPKRVMGVFAYDTHKDSNVGNPLQFLTQERDEYSLLNIQKRTGFLQQYAIEHDIPFIIFSD